MKTFEIHVSSLASLEALQTWCTHLGATLTRQKAWVYEVVIVPQDQYRLENLCERTGCKLYPIEVKCK